MQAWFIGTFSLGWGAQCKHKREKHLEKTTRQTTRQTTRRTTEDSRIVEAIIYDATVPNFASDDNHTNKFYTSTGVPIEVSLLIAIAAGENAIQLCREGAVPVITIGDVGSGGHILTPDTITLHTYNETTEDITDGLSQLLANTPPATIDTGSTSDQAAAALRCKDFFEADLPTLPIPLLPLTLALVIKKKVQKLKKFQKPKACRERGLNSATTLKNTPCPSTNSSGAEETTSYKPKCFFSVTFYPTLFLWAGVLRAPN